MQEKGYEGSNHKINPAGKACTGRGVYGKGRVLEGTSCPIKQVGAFREGGLLAPSRKADFMGEPPGRNVHY